MNAHCSSRGSTDSTRPLRDAPAGGRTRLTTLDPAEGAEARSSPRFDPDGPLSAHTPAPFVVPGGRWHGGDAGVQQEYECGTIPNAVTELRCPELRQDPEAGPQSRYSTDDRTVIGDRTEYVTR